MSAIDEPMESSEEDVTRVRLPNIKEGEMFGIADQLLGASKIRVMCIPLLAGIPACTFDDEEEKGGKK